MVSHSNKPKCDKCGAKSVLFALDDITVCSKCYLIYNPLVLRLDIYKNNPELWNKTQCKREPIMKIEDFLKCGWFLREIKSVASKVPKFTIKKMRFEYYGKCKCIRFLEYYKKLHLVHFKDCKNPLKSCERHVIK